MVVWVVFCWGWVGWEGRCWVELVVRSFAGGELGFGVGLVGGERELRVESSKKGLGGVGLGCVAGSVAMGLLGMKLGVVRAFFWMRGVCHVVTRQ